MGAPKCPSETRLSAAIENDTRSCRHISAAWKQMPAKEDGSARKAELSLGEAVA